VDKSELKKLFRSKALLYESYEPDLFNPVHFPPIKGNG